MLIYISTMDFNAGNLAGIGWALANNVFAVVDRLLQRLMLADDQDPVDISKTGVTFLNNLVGVVPLLVVGWLLGEIWEVPEAVRALDPGCSEAVLAFSLFELSRCSKLFWVISSCFVGAGISYTGVWVASLISATSFLVLINANKFFIIFLEVFVMKEKELSIVQIVGASISILAGIAYGKARDAVHADEKHPTGVIDDSESEKEQYTGDTEAPSGVMYDDVTRSPSEEPLKG
jgi:hypothetical protein